MLVAECWVWTRATMRGYGCLTRLIQGKRPLVHVYVYEHAIGPVPEGKQLHHVCHNKACYNPTHLLPLTRSEHRRLHAGDHCSKCGTAYSPKKNGKRYCKPCQNVRHRRYRAEGRPA